MWAIAKFQFRLEPVLKQRAAKEVAAEQALVLAHNKYNECLTLLENTKQRLEAAFKAAEKKEPDFFEVLHLSFYRASLNEKINGQEKSVSDAAAIVENKRCEAVQARQERQVLEKLKEQCLQNYRCEMADREQKVIDEIALYAHQRRMKQLQPYPV